MRSIKAIVSLFTPPTNTGKRCGVNQVFDPSKTTKDIAIVKSHRIESSDLDDVEKDDIFECDDCTTRALKTSDGDWIVLSDKFLTFFTIVTNYIWGFYTNNQSRTHRSN